LIAGFLLDVVAIGCIFPIRHLAIASTTLLHTGIYDQHEGS
jgi:hypothetical protein